MFLTRPSLVRVACLALAVALSAPARSEEKLDLRLRLAEGRSYRLGVTIDQDIEQVFGGQRQAMKQTIGLGYRMAVAAVDADGAMTVDTTYENVLFRQKGPAGAIEYDSNNPPPQIHPAARGFAAMVGLSFRMTVEPAGKVRKIEGVDAMIETVLKRVDLPEGPAKAATEKAIRTQFGERAMAENFRNMFGIYPPAPVAPGEAWRHKIIITSGFPMVLDADYTLKDRKQGVATVAAAAKLSPNPGAEPMQVGPSTVSYKLDGEQSGTIRIDELTGWTRSAAIEQQMAGEVTVATGGNTVTVPVTIKSTISIDSDEK